MIIVAVQCCGLVGAGAGLGGRGVATPVAGTRAQEPPGCQGGGQEAGVGAGGARAGAERAGGGGGAAQHHPGGAGGLHRVACSEAAEIACNRTPQILVLTFPKSQQTQPSQPLPAGH